MAAKLRYKELNAASRHSCKDVLARVHKEKTEKSAANRYKVVESLRKLDTSNVMEFKDKVFTFLDVEDSDSLALNQDVASTEVIAIFTQIFTAFTYLGLDFILQQRNEKREN